MKKVVGCVFMASGKRPRSSIPFTYFLLSIALILVAAQAAEQDVALVKVLEGHGRGVTSVHTDADYIYTASWDETVRVWSRQDFSLVKVLEGHDGAVLDVYANMDYIYTVSGREVRVWSRQDFSLVKVMEVLDFVESVYADADYIYTASAEATTRVWSRSDFSLVKVLEHTGWLLGVFADEDYIYTASEEATVCVWRRSGFSQVKMLEGHSNSVISVFADADYIFTASRDKTARVWRRSDFSVVKVLEGHVGAVTSVYADTDYIFTTSGDKTARVWSRQDFSQMTLLDGHTDSVNDVYADADYIYTASDDKTVRVWKRPISKPTPVPTPKPTPAPTPPPSATPHPVISLTPTPAPTAEPSPPPSATPRTVISPTPTPASTAEPTSPTTGTCGDGVCEPSECNGCNSDCHRKTTDKCFGDGVCSRAGAGETCDNSPQDCACDTEYECISTTTLDFGGGEHRCVPIDPKKRDTRRIRRIQHDEKVLGMYVDDDYIYTTTSYTPGKPDKTVQVWSRQDFSLVTALPGHESNVFSVYADNDYIYTSSMDNTARVWRRSDFSLVKVLEGHGDAVYDVHADADYIYTASWDKTVRVWSRSDFSLVKVMEHNNQVWAVYADADYIYTASVDGMVRLWSKSDFSLVKELTGAFDVYADADYIYTTAIGAAVWSRADFSPVKVLEGHGGGVSSVYADADYIYTASFDSTAQVWSRSDFSVVKVLLGHHAPVIHVYADASYIYTASADGTTGIWPKPLSPREERDIIKRIRASTDFRSEVDTLTSLGYTRMKDNGKDIIIERGSAEGIFQYHVQFLNEGNIITINGIYSSIEDSVTVEWEGDISLLEQVKTDPFGFLMEYWEIPGAFFSAICLIGGYLHFIKRKTLGEEDVKVKRGVSREGHIIKIGVKVINKSTFSLVDVGVELDIPKAFQIEGGSKYIDLGTIKQDEFQSAIFKLVPTRCVSGNITGSVIYQNIKNEKKMVNIEPVTVGSVCPFLEKVMMTPEVFNTKVGGLLGNEKRMRFNAHPSVIYQNLQGKCSAMYRVHEGYSIDGGKYIGMYSSRGAYSKNFIGMYMEVDMASNELLVRVYGEQEEMVTGLLSEIVEIVEEASGMNQ